MLLEALPLGRSVGPPDATFNVAGGQVRILGTIPGFVPDGLRLRSAWRAFGPTALGLGVPREDLAGLEALWVAAREGHEAPEMPGADPHTERLFEMLKPWGASQVPSPELEAAYDLAKANGTPVHALDFDDVAHADRFTSQVKMRHVIRSNAIQARMLKKPFPRHDDPYALAAAWDGELNRVGPLAEVERQREQEMARRIRELSAPGARLLVVVAAPRFDGVVRALGPSSSGP